MNSWYCGCVPPKLYPADAEVCPECGYARPPVLSPDAVEAGPAPVLGDLERRRMLGLAEWLDQEIARRPAIALSPVGTGLSIMIDRARRDPDGAYAQVADAAAAAESLLRWVRDAVPPDPAYLDRLIGPA